MGPSLIEQSWTGLFAVVLIVSIWQWRIAVYDARRKRREALYRDGNSNAAARLAKLLAYSVLLDCVAAFAWLCAGTLSVVRYYLEALNLLPEHSLVILLFVGAGAFGGRVVVRAYSRLIVNRL